MVLALPEIPWVLMENWVIAKEPEVMVPPLVELLQLSAGVAGQDAGIGIGIGRDGDEGGVAERTVDRDLEGDGAAGGDIGGQLEVDLVGAGETGSASGVERGDADAADDDLDVDAVGVEVEAG